MTNEEKAKELRLKYMEEGCGDSTDIRCACEDMAEWKDQQLLEYLEKKQAMAADAYSENTSDLKAGGLHMVFEIINELFGETEDVDVSNNDE